MSNQSIAELVYDLVKNPKSMISLENWIPSAELKTNEVAIIQRVFKQYEVSGDILALGYLPLRFWG